MEDFDYIVTTQGDTLRFELNTSVQRPVDEVFAFMTHGENNPKWELEIVDARQLTEGPPRVGTRWSYVRRFPGLGIKVRTISEIIEYELNQKWVVTSAVGSSSMAVKFTVLFEPVNGCTKLHFILVEQAAGLFRLMFPLQKYMFKKQAPINFSKLKELLEA